MWKDIPEYDGYQVSDSGEVRTHNKTTHTDVHGIRHWKDRVLKPKARKDGKRGGDDRVDLWRDGKVKTFKVSRLVAFTFYEADINDTNLTVDHLDGDWRNNNLRNLEIVTLKENVHRGFKNGLYGTCKAVDVTTKSDGSTTTYYSLAEASRQINKNPGYLSALINRGLYENNIYSWRLL